MDCNGCNGCNEICNGCNEICNGCNEKSASQTITTVTSFITTITTVTNFITIHYKSSKMVLNPPLNPYLLAPPIQETEL